MRCRFPSRWCGAVSVCSALAVVFAAEMGGARAHAKPRKEKKAMMKTTGKDPHQEQDAPPEPLFIERKVVPSLSLTGFSGTRVLQDGTCWTFSDSAWVIAKDGRWRREPLPKRWRSDGERLSEEEMDGLRRLLREKVLSLPAEDPAVRRVCDGTHIYWTIVLDDQRHTIHWVEGLEPMPPGLKELDARFKSSCENARRRQREPSEHPSRSERAK